jgi:hypothetical protein
MIVTQSLLASMAHDFGRDLTITLARAPWWGHADTCLLVNGRRHQEATQALIKRLAKPGATRFTAQLHEPRAGHMPRYSYTTLTIQP